MSPDHGAVLLFGQSLAGPKWRHHGNPAGVAICVAFPGYLVRRTQVMWLVFLLAVPMFCLVAWRGDLLRLLGARGPK